MLESKEYCDLISGFDMVNEEDSTPPIKDFVKQLYEAKHLFKGNFPLFLHGKS